MSQVVLKYPLKLSKFYESNSFEKILKIEIFYEYKFIFYNLKREFKQHFLNEGTPIMFGGGVKAFSLMGIDHNE